MEASPSCGYQPPLRSFGHRVHHQVTDLSNFSLSRKHLASMASFWPLVHGKESGIPSTMNELLAVK
ncbi:hypothetical protein E2562_023594 [Oryza meyeriana var. granulata]|uniref:Uncharacterized protein n=1 Tax=Oryza meyeriana var. granulata TaxID=110450 RepID=A0A6G1FBS4_9ORYZ|nr:hypothetical protein E2562_023594 [Oryza meyeriana var. granulata]